ncbi:hypothetical protein OJ998_16425 [Solirubrobacter taibaiensis]|nr:hypothetical protein [Solirubrobacter taibaiensis]
MASAHPQAYFDSDQVLASSPDLDSGMLLEALPRGDGLRASAVDGLGMVAARRVGDFTHVVAGLDGVFPIELSGWQQDDGDFDEVQTRPIDLGFLADAPPGVATRLLDAALAGPVVFSEPDEDLRLAWIAWLAYALPDGAALTFSTAGDEDARVRVADEPGAIDTTQPCDLIPSLYARVAVQLAASGELRTAVARLEEPDGLALAVHGGATELIAPHQLPLALQLITELATAGHVREAARAAAALPTGAASVSLVVREAEQILLPDVVEPEPELILEADVVEEPEPEPEPEPVAATDDPYLIRDDEIIEVPFELIPKEAVEEEPVFEPAPGAVIPDDVVVSVPFDVEPPEEPGEEPLPDMDAWSSLLSDLKTESVQPDETLPVLPEPVAPEPEPAAEMTYELGISLDAFAQSLGAAPEPEPEPEVAEEVLEEQEIGMSLAELEESLKREKRA